MRDTRGSLVPVNLRLAEKGFADKNYENSGNQIGSRYSYPEQAMRGDMDLERLTDEHYAALYRFGLSLCAQESDASDLVQETFYLLATKGHQLENPAKVKSWLFTTLYRLFLGRRRHLVRFPHHELAEVEEELPEAAPNLMCADWPLIAACLARLDETFRGPIALYYLEDCSYDEIAKILEIPLGTVKSRIARGIVQLQKMMIERAALPGGARNT
ncbi:MAG TPA: RNA polymerase sigma factor [Verrucomicrobiae bacterium]